MTTDYELNKLKKKLNKAKQVESREREKAQIKRELFRMKHKTLFKVGDALRGGLSKMKAYQGSGKKKLSDFNKGMANRRRLLEEL